jgi:hypothetical protein
MSLTPVFGNEGGGCPCIGTIRFMSKAKQMGHSSSNKPQIYDPVLKAWLPVVDSQEVFKRISDAHPFTALEKQAVIKRKAATLARAKYLDESQKAQTLFRIRDGSRSDSVVSPLLFGDVAEGIVYRPGQLMFTTTTSIQKTIAFPDKVGGDSNDYLYLTSTNRSAKGVEAHIAYHAQEPPQFWVYDWSRPADSRLALRIPYSDMNQFLFSLTIPSGEKRNGVIVLNSTELQQGTTWKNSVNLAGIVGGAPTHVVTVYTSTYTLTSNDEQHDSYFGSWGPQVETFQHFAQDLNTMGYFDLLLRQDGSEHALNDSNTFLRNDAVGLELVYQTPDRDFLVH